MHQILSALIYQFFLLPVDRAGFPATYEFYHRTESEYQFEYRWETDSRIGIFRRFNSDGKERNSFLFLGPDNRIVADSSAGSDGRPISVGRYEYKDGKLMSYLSSSQDVQFFYRGQNPDSIAYKKGDTLVEYYTYAYDAKGVLIRSDHFYDRDGSGRLQDNRSLVQYFLPDSMVIEKAFVPDNGERSRLTFFLAAGLPVRMIERETTSGSTHVDTHLWTYPGGVSLGRDVPGSLPLGGSYNPVIGVFDFLGRRNRNYRVMPLK